MKNKLHLFFPENDLALVRDLPNYTPPIAAVRLRRAGEALPLWYGSDGDRFVASGINAAWLDGMKNTFGMDIDVFDYRPDRYTPAPWGWSKASREVFLRLGFDKGCLPDDAALARMRELSHRRTSAEIGRRLALCCPAGSIAGASEELKSEDEVRRFVNRTGDSVLKLPWSSSGRGLVAVGREDIDARMPSILGMIRNQGSVMGEKHYHKTIDFAMLFTIGDGKCRYDGLSVFTTASLGSYEGNILAPQSQLEAMIKEKVDSDAFDSVRDSLQGILQDIIGNSYSGPLGVDMMGIDDDGVSLAPAVEMNLRMTMGHLCRLFYSRYVADGACGHFCVSAERKPDSFSAFDGRMQSGLMNLVPPGGSFNFFVSL